MMKTSTSAAFDDLSRREFIVTTGAAAGALVLGWAAPFDAAAQAAERRQRAQRLGRRAARRDAA